MYGLPPGRTGRRGRPRTKGDRLPCLAGLAATTAFTQVTVTRYGKAAAISAAAVTCVWPSVFGTRAVTVVLICDRSASGYDLALVTTDTAATAAQLIERYASRWSIEVAIEDARQVFGAGQARNPTARAVERTIPFQLACQAITTCWYATAGHDPADVAEHRARAPWYASKAQPSTADMAAKLRRVIIAARFKASRPDQPTCEEISGYGGAPDNRLVANAIGKRVADREVPLTPMVLLGLLSESDIGARLRRGDGPRTPSARR